MKRTHKECIECGVDKSLDEFEPKHVARCKLCRPIYLERVEREKQEKAQQIRIKVCRECCKELELSQFEKKQHVRCLSCRPIWEKREQEKVAWNATIHQKRQESKQQVAELPPATIGKYCNTCDIDKPLDEFAVSHAGTRYDVCLPCYGELCVDRFKQYAAIGCVPGVVLYNREQFVEHFSHVKNIDKSYRALQERIETFIAKHKGDARRYHDGHSILFGDLLMNMRAVKMQDKWWAIIYPRSWNLPLNDKSVAIECGEDSRGLLEYLNDRL